MRILNFDGAPSPAGSNEYPEKTVPGSGSHSLEWARADLRLRGLREMSLKASAVAPNWRPTGDIRSMVPAQSSGSKGLAHRFSNWLGHNTRGLTPLSLNRMPDAYAIESAGNATSGAPYTYDGLLAHDVLSLAGAAFSAAAGSRIAGRYRDRLDAMLQAEVKTLQRACAIQERQRRLGGSTLKPADDQERARYPALDAHYRDTDAAFVGNLLITRDSKGNWQYDKHKLLRIAQDGEHTHARHARDVLTLMYIEKHRGRHRRNDAVFQSVAAGLNAAASALMIGGTHGAALPAVAAGYAVASGRELMFFKAPLVQHRQALRDAKAEQITRIVTRDLARIQLRAVDGSSARVSASQAGEPLAKLPGSDLLLDARAGIVAAAWANARKRVEGQRFSKWIPGAWIDESKSTAAKRAERELVVNHVLEELRHELARLDRKSPQVLRTLRDLSGDPSLSLSRRVKAVMTKVKAEPVLYAAHTLLTDMGMRKSEALAVMARLIDVHFGHKCEGGEPNALLSDLDRIANRLAQPQLKPATVPAIEAELHGALMRRSALL